MWRARSHSSFVIRHLNILMKRPWQVWLLFATCVLGVLAGMTWLTQQALRADERRRAAEAEAELVAHIRQTVTRYAGAIPSWDVINEPIPDRPT